MLAANIAAHVHGIEITFEFRIEKLEEIFHLEKAQKIFSCFFELWIVFVSSVPYSLSLRSF